MKGLFGEPYEKRWCFQYKSQKTDVHISEITSKLALLGTLRREGGGEDLKEHSKSKNIFVSELYLPTMACELLKEKLNPAVMLLIVAVSRSQKYFNMAKKHLFHLLLLHIAPFYTIISSACFQLRCFTEISPSCQVRTQVESI